MILNVIMFNFLLQLLEREGLRVEFGLVFIDRQQGGKRRVKQLVNKEVHR